MSTAIIKPHWSPISIAFMVVGFMLFWPLGMAMLGYILWGEYFGGTSDKAERWMHKNKEWARSCKNKARHGRHAYRNTSGNAAFDDYRDEQLKHLEEERRRLDAEVGQFHDYMDNLHKARDREEFDRFMKARDEKRDWSDKKSDDKKDDDNGSDDDKGSRQGY